MALTFVDRSRYNTGLGECMFARYLGYSHEYTGVAANNFSVPLTTGGQVHAVLEHILYYLKDNDMEIPDSEIRELIQIAKEAYEDEVNESTWSSYDDDGEILNYIIKEQTTLLEGLIWCWAESLIPWIKESYEIVAIEEEFNLIIGCTCGLGKLITDPKLHDDKDCNGVCLMTRPDLVLKNKTTNNLAYIEFKTGAYVTSENYPAGFYDNVQFVLGARAAEIALEQNVTELFVHGLHKGSRKQYKAKGDTFKKQLSSICYAYVKPGSPPLGKPDISPEYYKIIEKMDGTTSKWGCTEKRGYTKLPVWEYEFENVPDEMTPIEHYIRNIMTQEQRQANIRVIGPISNSTFLSEKLLSQMIHEESRWRERTEIIAEVAESSGSWESEETIEIIEELITRSWQCKKYGDEFMCTYKPYCHEELGESLLENNKYIRRDPNHPIEKEIGEFYNRFEV